MEFSSCLVPKRYSSQIDFLHANPVIYPAMCDVFYKDESHLSGIQLRQGSVATRNPTTTGSRYYGGWWGLEKSVFICVICGSFVRVHPWPSALNMETGKF
jgi:hypothetical protein